MEAESEAMPGKVGYAMNPFLYAEGKIFAQIEQGQVCDKPITFKNLERICQALDCTPNDVFSFDDFYR